MIYFDVIGDECNKIYYRIIIYYIASTLTLLHYVYAYVEAYVVQHNNVLTIL